MYREGFRTADIPKDPKQGLKWLQKSADHGYARAEYNLALLYQDGDDATGIPRNPHEAAAWFRKAARQPGNPGSRTELEKMLKKHLISEPEANWRPPFSLGEVETGLKGWITNKRMARLVQEFGVDFKMNPATQKRLANDGADDNLLQTISASRRSL
jgi:TPR repeat protein